ncbi:MAG: CDP-diacylglycerol--glycerol-3-phosphate 3-phosphatidyltransferase [Ignavibacteriaceae bacterium]|nr:CDP-diacylglycerol--glycerol-3-phosphate 3-phosphatidyltransferase [Ignavibacteriaceae bacterium]
MILPNQLTILRIILTPVFLFFFLTNNPELRQISLIIFILAALTDWYDGWLARKFNYITNWGKFWDPLADKILTSAGFIALVVAGKLELWMVIIIITRDIMITILRSLANYKEVLFVTEKSAKWKTALQMTFLYYVLILTVFESSSLLNTNQKKFLQVLLNENLVYFGMLIITILTFYSGVNYLYKNRQLLRKLILSEN